ncbi:hypothetical protein [Lolliginicoccus suaedae]|uniref:hypothetical protein n=1 Tax=Lolliginicoccus suaedae TaxID=2605429 RepID=UPI0011EC4392|nr:hypothetical protein [Lolliginicoccus suaedae]
MVRRNAAGGQRPERGRRPRIAGHNRARSTADAQPGGEHDAGPGSGEPVGTGGGAAASAGPGAPRWLIVLVVVLALVAAIATGVLVGTRGMSALAGGPAAAGPAADGAGPAADRGSANRAFVDEAATEQVRQRAVEAVETIFSYSHETLDEDFEAARGYLTESMRENYDSTIGVTEDVARQLGAVVETTVPRAGVAFLGEDEAEVLVLTSVSTVRSDGAVDQASGPLRLELVQVDGEWLVDAIIER